jgi:hypothetical protein
VWIVGKFSDQVKEPDGAPRSREMEKAVPFLDLVISRGSEGMFRGNFDSPLDGQNVELGKYRR